MEKNEVNIVVTLRESEWCDILFGSMVAVENGIYPYWEELVSAIENIWDQIPNDRSFKYDPEKNKWFVVFENESI